MRVGICKPHSLLWIALGLWERYIEEMCKEMKPMTFEEVQKLRSETHWDKLRNEEPDTLDPESLPDPDAPDFSEIMGRENELSDQKTRSCSRPQFQ